MDSEPEGRGPEEIRGDVLASGVVVGAPVEFDRGGGTVNGTGLPVTDAVGVKLLSPLDPTVGPLGSIDDAVEFDKGYGAELLGMAPDVPPVGRAVSVTEAVLGGMMEFAVEFGWYDETVGSVVDKAGDAVPGTPLPVDPELPVGPGAGSVELVRG
jgi:hypothetical protein